MTEIAIIASLVDNLISATLSIGHKVLIFGGKADKAVAEITQWQTILADLWCCLQIVEDKKQDDLEVQRWLKDLEELTYDSEDTLEEFNYEAVRHQTDLRFRWRSKASWPKSEMLDKLGDVTGRLQILMDKFGSLNLGNSSATPKFTRVPSVSDLNEPVVFSRDEEKEAILRRLLAQEDSEPRSNVIPIVGMGGLGKTTLAKYVYHDSRVECSFDVRVWVCVSSDYDPTRIYKEILQSVCNNCSVVADKSLDWIQRNLGEALRDKKLLLVLDDYWNDNYADWNALRSLCLQGSPGNGIIVTTRSHYVAKIVSAVDPIIPRHFSDEDCWLLLCIHAGLDQNANSFMNVEEICKRIAIKCSGLPLAVISVGGHLRNKTKVEQWEAILNGMWKDIGDDVISVLKMSYDDLDSMEKRCFSGLALFPAGYEFKEDEVVLMWVGAGLIQFKEEEDKNKIEQGHKVFHSLVAKSLLSPTNGSSTEHFVMHDMVRHLAQQVCRMNRCIEKDDTIDESFKSIRHLSFHGSNLEDIVNGIVKEDTLLLPLRTIWAVEKNNVYDLKGAFTRLKFIRVLRFQYLQNKELPESIGQLTLLRYLDVSYSKIWKLPTSITSLYNLEILILYGCGNLHQLPERTQNLINLCYLDITATKIENLPKGILKLRKLRNFSVSSVGNLTLLQGILTNSNIQNVESLEDGRLAPLFKKRLLEELRLSCYSAERSQAMSKMECPQDILEKLQPCRDLKELKIANYPGSLLPNWLTSSLESLVVLDLENCKYCTSQLEAMASLEKLRIVNCPEMIVFLRHILWLKKLEIRNCKIVACTETFSLDSLECVTVENVDVEKMSKFFKEKLRQGSRHARVLQFGVDWRETEIRGRNVIPDWKLPSIHLIGDDDSCQMKVQYLSVHKEASLECLPKWVSNAPSLQELDIKDCPSLKILLPYGEVSSSLTKLCISGCSELESFHQEKLPTTIQHLEINDCSVLEKKIEDKDWQLCSKISHIPSIQVNSRMMSFE